MSKAAHSLRSNKVTILWKSINNFCSSNITLFNYVDEIRGNKNITPLFKLKCENLFSSVPSNQKDLCHIATSTENTVKTHCVKSYCYSQHSIGVNDVKNAIKQLKHGKHDGHNAVYSDHSIQGSHRLYVMIALLLTKLMTHNVVPSGVLQSVLIPIPKDKSKALTDSNKRRVPVNGHCVS